MEDRVKIDKIRENDIDEIVSAFKAIGWNKPASIYDDYLKEQEQGLRSVIVAKVNGKFCGYVTLKYQSEYPAFSKNRVPEISDLNVLPDFRNKGIGTCLINECEKLANVRGCRNIGIGVGMTADYGNAQRLYVQLGYAPDGNGLHYKNQPLHYGDKADVDDDLVLYFTKCLLIK